MEAKLTGIEMAQRLVNVLNEYLNITEVSAACGELEYLVAEMKPNLDLSEFVTVLMGEACVMCNPEKVVWVEEGVGFSVVDDRTKR